MKRFFFILLFVFLTTHVFSQKLSNIIEKEIPLVSDTIVLDSLSIIPNSLEVYLHDQLLSQSLYSVNYEEAKICFKKDLLNLRDLANLTCKIKYRVFPVNFLKPYYHKTTDLIGDSINRQNNKRYSLEDNSESFFSSSQLSKSGSISRGINFGNNQDASVNSDFNLQLSGKISPEISVSANISDSNIPVQADGTSQNLREFDKVFIELSSENTKLKVGDFEISKPKGYFMNYHKKLQGLGFNTKINSKKKNKIETSLNGAISKGKYNRQKIVAVEGNQGPYKLEGVNNEMYVIVLSGSEKVFIDGKLLERGFENDYTINYNSAEITFTASQIITKDTRIIVEFEYSEMSYARFIVSSENKFSNKKSDFYFNIFSESDAKNQNLRQDLSVEQKLLFNEIGDNLQNALVPNINEIDTFNTNEVLYRKTDTIVATSLFSNVYVYSTDSLQAKYRLGFSYVGENGGDYTRIQSSANGRVYKWIAPQNGIKQGDYEPIRILISPKKKQMISFGGNFELRNTNVTFETAISNNDLNTFSDKDKNDNIGYAIKFGLHKNLLKKDTSKVQLNIGANYIFSHKNFEAVETYRSTEFTRDWNLQSLNTNKNEHILNAFLEYKKKNFGKLAFYSDLLSRQENYFGNNNKFIVNIQKKKMLYFADVNLLTSKDTINNTEFIRYNFKVERKGAILTTGIKDFGEKNIFNILKNDSLSLNSYRFNQIEIYLKTSNKIKTPFILSYANREDFLPENENLTFVSNSHNYKFSGTLIKNKKQRLKTSITYRMLNIADTLKTNKTSEKTLIGKLEHSLKFFKGAIANSIFVEHSTGNELVKEFTYLEVQSGQGLFTWQDFNKNNVKELNEFVRANFQDEANFIRVSIPTNKYKPVYNQKFNFTLNLNPKRIWFNEKGVKNLISNFSNRLSYKLNRKINSDAIFYNISIPDSSLISFTELLSNNLSLNIAPTKTTFNFIYIANKSKVLLINGIDTRENNFYNLLFNQRIKSFIIANTYKVGNKSYNSEFFSESNYNIKYFENKLSLTYQIANKTDLIANFILKNKKNTLGEEEMNSYNIGAEYKFASKNQGNIITKLDFINISYLGKNNTSISYEILEGLKTGKNYIWSVLWFKRITKYLQLEINYSGRKSEENKIIHSGGVSVRAIF